MPRSEACPATCAAPRRSPPAPLEGVGSIAHASRLSADSHGDRVGVGSVAHASRMLADSHGDRVGVGSIAHASRLSADSQGDRVGVAVAVDQPRGRSLVERARSVRSAAAGAGTARRRREHGDGRRQGRGPVRSAAGVAASARRRREHGDDRRQRLGSQSSSRRSPSSSPASGTSLPPVVGVAAGDPGRVEPGGRGEVGMTVGGDVHPPAGVVVVDQPVVVATEQHRVGQRRVPPSAQCRT